MTPRELLDALSGHIDAAAESTRRCLSSFSRRLREVELRLARIEERLCVERRFREPFYRALVQAVAAGLAGAAAAILSGLAR